jgi:UDP-glucose:(heptosyl)LPS alpha-1,3-glucosyltransferase
LKIGLVIERLETWRGGAETSTGEIARLLAARGHDVHVVTSTNCQSPPGLTIHTVPALAMIPALRAAAFARHAAALLRRMPCDVVHAVSPLPTADLYQPRGGLLRETMERNVATRRGRSRKLLKRALLAMNVKQRALLDLERQIFQRGGPGILAVSNYVARQCERYYSVGSPRVRVIFNGVRVETPTPEERTRHRRTIREEHRVTENTLLLLFMAHNFRLKGLSPLIETAARLVTSGFRRFRVLIVGRDNPSRYQRLIQARRLDACFTFIGPTQRAAAFYSAADVLIHPTYYDPCSRVVLEALSHGLPCITTSYNGAAEVISDGAEGFVIDTPDNVGLMARRIEEMASAELREKMARRAETLKDRLSMERHVEQLDAVYREIYAAKQATCPTASGVLPR